MASDSKSPGDVIVGPHKVFHSPAEFYSEEIKSNDERLKHVEMVFVYFDLHAFLASVG